MAIATHHPHPDHLAEMEGHMILVRNSVRGAEGLIEFDCYRSTDGARLLGVSKWVSREAFESALPSIGRHAERRREEWTIGEDELVQLEEF
jgi:quinol monooxygenase YgiN